MKKKLIVVGIILNIILAYGLVKNFMISYDKVLIEAHSINIDYKSISELQSDSDIVVKGEVISSMPTEKHNLKQKDEGDGDEDWVLYCFR